MELHGHATVITTNADGRKHGGTAEPGARAARARERADRRVRLARLKHACELEGVPYTTARDAAARKELIIARFGRAIFVAWEDFDRWVAGKFERAK